MKLLASAAALFCACCLLPGAAWARSADFERRAPDRESARIVAPKAFNLVGLRWKGSAAPDAEIRVRRGSRWTRWQHLGVHGAGGSDPAWVGRARVVQYRLSRRVRARVPRIADVASTAVNRDTIVPTPSSSPSGNT